MRKGRGEAGASVGSLDQLRLRQPRPYPAVTPYILLFSPQTYVLHRRERKS